MSDPDILFCIVPSCKKTSKMHGVHFYPIKKFWRNPDKWSKWLDALGPLDKIPQASSLICSVHFTTSDYKMVDQSDSSKYGSSMIPALRSNAVPHLRLPAVVEKRRYQEMQNDLGNGVKKIKLGLNREIMANFDEPQCNEMQDDVIVKDEPFSEVQYEHMDVDDDDLEIVYESVNTNASGQTGDQMPIMSFTNMKKGIEIMMETNTESTNDVQENQNCVSHDALQGKPTAQSLPSTNVLRTLLSQKGNERNLRQTVIKSTTEFKMLENNASICNYKEEIFNNRTNPNVDDVFVSNPLIRPETITIPVSENTERNDFETPVVTVNQNGIVCKYCDTLFESQETFDQHSPPTCEACVDKSIVANRHVCCKIKNFDVNSSKYEFYCDPCSSKFTSFASITAHFDKDHPSMIMACTCKCDEIARRTKTKTGYVGKQFVFIQDRLMDTPQTNSSGTSPASDVSISNASNIINIQCNSSLPSVKESTNLSTQVNVCTNTTLPAQICEATSSKLSSDAEKTSHCQDLVLAHAKDKLATTSRKSTNVIAESLNNISVVDKKNAESYNPSINGKETVNSNDLVHNKPQENTLAKSCSRLKAPARSHANPHLKYPVQPPFNTPKQRLNTPQVMKSPAAIRTVHSKRQLMCHIKKNLLKLCSNDVKMLVPPNYLVNQSFSEPINVSVNILQKSSEKSTVNTCSNLVESTVNAPVNPPVESTVNTCSNAVESTGNTCSNPVESTVNTCSNPVESTVNAPVTSLNPPVESTVNTSIHTLFNPFTEPTLNTPVKSHREIQQTSLENTCMKPVSEICELHEREQIVCYVPHTVDILPKNITLPSSAATDCKLVNLKPVVVLKRYIPAKLTTVTSNTQNLVTATQVDEKVQESVTEIPATSNIQNSVTATQFHETVQESVTEIPATSNIQNSVTATQVDEKVQESVTEIPATSNIQNSVTATQVDEKVQEPVTEIPATSPVTCLRKKGDVKVWCDVFNIVCNGCMEQFSKFKDVLTHITKFHECSKYCFQCMCKQSFMSLYFLQKHLNEHHLEMKLEDVLIKPILSYD